MKSTSILVVFLLLVSLIAATPLVRVGYAQAGPRIDILRHTVIRSPDAALIAMQTDTADISPDQIRTGDIEKQDTDGMLITQDLGFHMGFIGWNIRPLATINAIRAVRALPPVSYWPLHDAAFRHALIHGYDQLGIIAPIYGYVVTPVRSLVPPAQSKYYSSAAEEHPYSPGDPFTSPPTEHSTCGILKAAGYTFQDAGTIGVVDDADYWKTPGGHDMPYMVIWTPLFGDAPTSFQHGAEFVADLATVGLAATTANGNKGLLNEGRDFNDYLDDVYGTTTAPGGRFDAFMVFYGLGRIPDQLYSMCNTAEDVWNYWDRTNSAGVNDPTIDTLTNTIKYSLDTDVIEDAAKEVQERLYNVTLPNADNFALAYMLLYSRSYFNVFTEGLEGIVKSPGYGSDNGWTYLNAQWKSGHVETRTEGGKTVMIYINGLPPDSLNPCYATTAYEWNIITPVTEGLTAVNPYNHYDMPWIASDWTITETVGGMEIDFTLNSDVEWQDGKPITAYDVEWCLEFLRNYQVPRYSDSWEQLVDVVVTDNTHVTVEAAEAGLALFYDYSGLGLLCPEHLWNRFGNYSVPANRQAVLNYDPTEGYNLAPGYTVDWADPITIPTNLMGPGPWVFQFYDPSGEYDDMWRNTNYFMTQAEITSLLTEMFWEVGDTNRNGEVNVVDLDAVSTAYGRAPPHPDYNVNADFDKNDFCDMRDMRTSAYHLKWKRTHAAIP